MTTDALVMRNIDKSFNGVPVLKGASFTLRRGECHALMGENGAGKSTLMKILAGVHARDAGTVEVAGTEVSFATPREAELAGISMIYQEFSLVPTLTVAQNIFLGHEPKSLRGGMIRDKDMVAKAREILSELGERIDPRERVENLSVGAKQITEIAKALSKNARIIVMDEPTASLSEEEAERLFTLVRKLKSNGISIVYISHRMSEIFRICDRITAMRDGRDVLTAEAGDVSMEQLIRAMLGDDNSSSMHWIERGIDAAAQPVLTVRNLSVRDLVHDVSFDVRPGEIVGLAGLTGAGRTEIVESIFGLRRADAGEVRIGGRTVRDTREAIAAGAAFVPEDRRTQGLVLDHAIKDNVILPSLEAFSRRGVIRDSAARKATRKHIGGLKIRAEGPGQIVRFLSGGNQQKIVLAKWLERAPKLLILDEPTIGVDIGAKADLVDTIRQAADAGTAVLVISSEFEELLAVSDRLLIIHDGRLIREMPRQAVDSEEVLHHAVQG
ncbi:sugar ABC transporter ATP-binding protein [Maliponia aquimaris]|uniref:Galactose/methyl galactoside import ATP-binding protein MglA n=1 Tax=Maliponia aquimaris TaxID=1673631 RepID=A0A238K668_9RHOB|nr:sugar ABC transporter ATP-binding protein [Maliponia aquimaris]SMX37957.1 Galactose/methyl galactoside import ATP-binding protein MglA [Maliponia aquimaris]